MNDYREFRDGELVPGTRYRVARLIGAGGMGRVYEVEHVELGKRFVLKALQRELSRRDDLVQRLRNEWRALARLEHPSIVNVTDAGTSDNGVPFYVMERLEGETLAALLYRQRRLHPAQALAIAAGLLEGLHAAHQIGVVHRDVKPPNVFLTAPTSVKILDFGIAKIQDAKGVITARGIAVGTPRYMSPEQAQGVSVDARSDIYATGLILFEMVSGVGPFDDARDHNEMLLAHLGRPAPLLSSISVVAPELDALVAGMLAKDPRERPADAQQLAESLRVLSSRYVGLVGSETPTINAVLGTEPPTRVDVRRSAPAIVGAGTATVPDAPAAKNRDDTTAQPLFQLATTELPPPSSQPPGSTQRLIFTGRAPATLYGSDTRVDPPSQAPTGIPAGTTGAPVETTLELTSVPLPPGAQAYPDAGPTRTSVPLGEAPNVTPPPAIAPASASGGRPRTPWAPIAIAAVLLFGVAAGAVWGLARPKQAPAPPLEERHVATAAALLPPAASSVTSAIVPASPPPAAIPSALASSRAPAMAPADAAAPPVVRAAPSIAAAPSSAPKPVPVAPAPPRAVSAPPKSDATVQNKKEKSLSVATPAPAAAPAKPKPAMVMPGSGL